MNKIRHKERPPDIAPLLQIFDTYEVRFILTGSVAALLYGVELEPGDIDIVPQPGRENLAHLEQAIVDLQATPQDLGHWVIKDDGEKKWISDVTSLPQLLAWSPDINEINSFDHLFFTRLGNLDVVPETCGDYHTLNKRALRKDYLGYSLLVAHIDEILIGMTVPRRPKDRDRVKQLRNIQRNQSYQVFET